MTTIKDVVRQLENFAPLSLQESYDNSGLIVGNSGTEVKNVLLCIDCTEEVVEEAVKKKCNLIISHHPILFSPLKRLNGNNYVERTIMTAIKNEVAIYAMHTNLDSVTGGVNTKMAEKLRLENVRILRPMTGNLRKLVTYVPPTHADKVRQALFDAGAGHISHYDHCSFNAEGFGTFRGDDSTQPFLGEKNKEAKETEIRIETVYPHPREKNIIESLFMAHPYEEVAYDIYKLENPSGLSGIGVKGELKKAISLNDFLLLLKKTFRTTALRYTKSTGKKIKKVALCGGSGSFLIQDAIRAGADVFVTADLKYHQFFDADDKIVLADIGHFESEQFTTEIIDALLTEKFNTFATYFSRVKTNPIKYF